MEELNDHSDVAIIEEVKKRFVQKERSLQELEKLTSELLKRNEELRKAESSRAKFISLIRNEFNNPMSVMLSLSKRITTKGSTLENIEEIGKMLHLEILRMDYQLKNIFSITELEAGQLQTSPVKIYLNQMIQDVREELLFILEDKHVHFQDNLPADTVVFNDADKLYMILLNAFAIVSEYSNSDSTISLTYNQNDNDILIIENNSTTLPENVKKVIDNLYDYSSYNVGIDRVFSGLGVNYHVAKELADIIDATLLLKYNKESIRFVLIMNKQGVKSCDLGIASDEVFFEEFDELESDNDAVEF